ncbi:MAG: hypothetical protein IPI50_16370 [Saprospiraceae bacterium]|nr:hypothetical protein [Saprospiraceae bacterium]
MNLQNVISYIKDKLEKIFWPLIVCYALYLVFEIYSYYDEKESFMDKVYFENMYQAKFLTLALILAAALIFKVTGKVRIASLILVIPAIITVGTFLIVMLVIAGLAILFILFGN